DDSTYSNKEVVKLLKTNFISTKADQDANPDLANRYREYGWPATIIFDANGNEIIKRRGYMNPRVFLKLLNAVVADPTPEEPKEYLPINGIENAELSERVKQLEANLKNHLDYEN